MGDCEFLGEKALLGKNATRGATVTASSKAEVFVLSRHQFELLENDGLPIKEIVANVKHKVKQYEKDLIFFFMKYSLLQTPLCI